MIEKKKNQNQQALFQAMYASWKWEQIKNKHLKMEE